MKDTANLNNTLQFSDKSADLTKFSIISSDYRKQDQPVSVVSHQGKIERNFFTIIVSNLIKGLYFEDVDKSSPVLMQVHS